MARCCRFRDSQNKATELLALLRFSMPRIFGDFGHGHHGGTRGERSRRDKEKKEREREMQKLFASAEALEEGDGARSTESEGALARVRRLVEPFILRRRKVDVLMQLPKKTEEIGAPCNNASLLFFVV